MALDRRSASVFPRLGRYSRGGRLGLNNLNSGAGADAGGAGLDHGFGVIAGAVGMLVGNNVIACALSRTL